VIRPGTIKICGLKEPEHAVAAAVGGADIIGFIFAPTRRYVDPQTARRAIDAAKAAAIGNLVAVGVFVNSPVADMNAVAEEAGLDAIQLSGDEDPDDLQGVGRPLIKALRPPAGTSPDALLGVIERWNATHPPVTFLVDGFRPGHFGGSGTRTDWQLAAFLAAVHPIMLAGGLTPENVADAIGAVSPLGVDVSTGVEVEGRKDSAAIHAFIKQARSAFSPQPEWR